MITTAYVHLWGKRVGAVVWDNGSQLGSFQCDPSFLANKWELAPLKMPLSDKIFSFPELIGSPTFKGLRVFSQTCYLINTETS